MLMQNILFKWNVLCMYVMEMLLYISFAPSAQSQAYNHFCCVSFRLLVFLAPCVSFSPSNTLNLSSSVRTLAHIHTYAYTRTYTQTGLPKSDMHACINYICLFGGSWMCSNRIHLNLLYIFFILPSFGILFICIYLSLASSFFCVSVWVNARMCCYSHGVLFILTKPRSML